MSKGRDKQALVGFCRARPGRLRPAAQSDTPALDMVHLAYVAPPVPPPEKAKLRSSTPMLVASASAPHRCRRLAAWAGVGLGMAASIALGIWIGQHGWHAAPGQPTLLVVQPAQLPAIPNHANALAAAPSPVSASVPLPEAAPRPSQTRTDVPGSKQPERRPADPLLGPPHRTSHRRAHTPSRVEAGKPTTPERSLREWENRYVRSSQDGQAPQAASNLEDQVGSRPPPYIGVFVTDADGVRTFRRFASPRDDASPTQ